MIARLTQIVIVILGVWIWQGQALLTNWLPSLGAPPYVVEDLEPPTDEYSWIQEWRRPPGPPRVGLQVGHWQNADLPDELSRLIGSTGSSSGQLTEWEAMLAIAETTKSLLEKQGVIVDILPATVPVRYEADAFVALHADGATTPIPRGFKAASPRRDWSGHAAELLTTLTESYGRTTQLPADPQISRAMRGYYAFAWWRYDHSVHPMTPSIILETGFLTSPADRRIIVNQPALAARGIAEGLLNFLAAQNLPITSTSNP